MIRTYRTEYGTQVTLAQAFPGEPYRDEWGDLWEVDPYTEVAFRKRSSQGRDLIDPKELREKGF